MAYGAILSAFTIGNRQPSKEILEGSTTIPNMEVDRSLSKRIAP